MKVQVLGRPGGHLLFSHPKSPIVCLAHQHPLAKNPIFDPEKPYRRRTHASSSAAPLATSATPSRRAADAPGRPSPSSLYSRPSLQQMKAERAANRARVYEFRSCAPSASSPTSSTASSSPSPSTSCTSASNSSTPSASPLTTSTATRSSSAAAYPLVLGCSVKKNIVPVLDYLGKLGVRKATFTEFLRSLGVVPDELDGLELPVTVDVMHERVEFLHSLGLTVDDINSYPLVLGCSVKKNIVPVLDYLGKLGVRKATFTEFLRSLGVVPDELDGLELPVTVDVMHERVEFLHSLGSSCAPSASSPTSSTASSSPVTVDVMPSASNSSTPSASGPRRARRLELPVTVDVMHERVEFLHSLGLTVDDINSYPLVLGCSVKKNIVPVLDYLGKLGVRKATFTEFLRRYPQVLHSSVVVDLMPVVKYLQGLDIRPNDIPRVLERYPEVLGFKLEGTMSTSVAYLVGIGVARREIGGVLTRYPELLGMRVGKVIKPFVEYLESIGLPRLAVARLIEKRPHILGFSLEEQVKPNVEALLEFGVRQEAAASVIAQYPDIMGLELKAKLTSQQSLFESNILVDRDEFGRVIEKMPQAVSLSRSTVLKHVDFLKGCGFLLNQVGRMVVGCPQLLALNLDIMKMSFEYFQSEMDRDLEELVAFPAFFTYGLESTVRPRHRITSKRGIKCSLAWLLNCSDEKFEERMKYDSIGIEEMETEPSFDMKSLLQPRKDEESASEYEDSDYEDTDEEYL
ncbi:hypothetical protein C4D60_Mb01t06860 [Musa balbisiana]|uniref:Transcription termination factor MTERF4, chloroplastic n=1 Tax=Musa balbisiana TaxID=52838 RepID=A0A4S8JME7_MUSBA|nr:hypothetical protein C4D60_Mb01t06860 [Musa balbisiana]